MSAAVRLSSGLRLLRVDGGAMPDVCCARCVRWRYRADQTLLNAVGECRKGQPKRPTRRRGRWPLTKAAAACRAFVKRGAARNV